MRVQTFLLGLQSAIGGIILVLAIVGFRGIVSAPAAPPPGGCGTTSGPLNYTQGVRPDSLGNFDRGKHLWNTNGCGSCHNRGMQHDALGPALSEVLTRWRDYPRSDLYDFVRNSQAMIAAGHPRAVAVYERFAPTVMNTYQDLTDTEIEDLLAYITAVY